MQYSENSIYICSRAKLSKDMPSGEIYKTLDIGLVINPTTGIVEDASITLITPEAIMFLKQIIVGFSLNDETIDILIGRIKSRYLGTSQKAICVTLRHIHEKYKEYIEA